MPEPRRGKDFSQELAEKGWYHSFDLPDGTRIEGYNQIDTLRRRYARFPIPADLTGRRVLDIGAWDGWFSFEAERHGGEVTAIDCVEIANFLELQKILASRVRYRILDFYELPAAGLGVFDFVFCLAVLYHLKHPLLALEIVCGLTTDTAIVESFVTDADTWQEHRNEVPTMEFYETDELGNQLDNWIGPSVSCLMAMCRAAGFARVEFLHSTGLHAGVAGSVLPEVGADSGEGATPGARVAGGGEFANLRHQFFHPQGGVHYLLVPGRGSDGHARSTATGGGRLRRSGIVREAGRKRRLDGELPPAAGITRGMEPGAAAPGG